jgi:hypothetical protein
MLSGQPWRGRSKLTVQATGAHASKLWLTQSALWVRPVLKAKTHGIELQLAEMHISGRRGSA